MPVLSQIIIHKSEQVQWLSDDKVLICATVNNYGHHP